MRIYQFYEWIEQLSNSRISYKHNMLVYEAIFCFTEKQSSNSNVTENMYRRKKYSENLQSYIGNFKPYIQLKGMIIF